MKRIERNSKILKEAEQDQPLKKTTIDLSRLAPMKIKDKNKKLKSKSLDYKTNTKGLFGVGKL